MSTDDATPIVIRNQRVRGPVALVWVIGWGVLWLAAAWVAEQNIPMEWHRGADLSLLVIILASFVVMMIWLDHHPRVTRVKLAEEMRVYPNRHYKPTDVAAVRLGPDPDEDYVDAKLPVPLCEVTIEPRRGRAVRLIASAADARRLRMWAESKDVMVDDSHRLLSENPRGVQSNE